MSVTALLSVGDGLSADHIDLMDDAKHMILAGGADFSEPGRITLTLAVSGATADAMATNYQSIQTKLRQAEIAVREGNTSDRVTFGWQFGTTNTLYYDVLSGVLSPMTILPLQTHVIVTLELRCLPWARGVSITDTVTATLTNGVAQWLRADVPGDYPALVKIAATDVSTGGTVLSRMRIALRSATSAVLGDFDPWVDAAALAPGANTPTTTPITSSSVANPTVITTSAPHNLVTGDVVTIAGHTGSTPAINGSHTATVTSTTTFTIPVNVTVGGTGGTVTDPRSHFGGGYSARTDTSTTMVNVARATMPAGALNKGRFDLRARVYGSGTAMGQPTSLTATVTAPTTTTTPAVTETKTTTNSIEQVQTAAARTTSLTTIAPTWDAATTTGNLLVLVVFEQSSDAAITVPAGWTLAKSVTTTFEAGNELTMFVYYIKNAASRSGAESISGLTVATAGDPNAALLIELSGAYGGAANVIVGSIYATATADTITPAYTSTGAPFVGAAVLAIIGTAGAATASRLDYWNGGAEEVYAGNELMVGLRRFSSINDSVNSTAQMFTSALAYVYITLMIRPGTTTVVNTIDPAVTTIESPTPGSLAVGTYGFRVQAVDPVGTLSSPVGTVNGVVATVNSKIALAWVAPSGTVSYYKVTYSFGSRFYTFYTTDATASATVTAITEHAEATALPTTGDAAPMPRVRVRVGTSGSLTTILSDLPERTISGATWHHLKLASAVDLPPVGEHLGGTRPEWAVEVQMRSANGLNATARVDALWLAPHDEAQATLEYPGLTLATLRRWVAETDRAGRHMTGWLEDTGTSAESGRLTCAGAMTLSPGDSIICLLLEKAAGVSDLVDSKVQVQLTLFPRFAWTRGLP